MDKTRMNDMVDRYGELCSQQAAGRIMGVSTRTIARMLNDKRLRRVGSHVDVRSICEYIENPDKHNNGGKRYAAI